MKRLEAFAQIATQASRGELVFPTSVNAALQLHLALDDPECHIDRAIELALGEPLLAARTVALANSAAFQRQGGSAITNVRTAVLRVGYQNLQTMVAAMVVRQFGARIEDPALRAKAEQLWEHTVHVATLARVVARRITGVNQDTATFAATVHEVGGFYLLSRAEAYPGLLDGEGAYWVGVGEEIVAAQVMKKMALPEPVCAALEALRVGRIAEPPTTLGDTLILANQFAPVCSPLELPYDARMAGDDPAGELLIDADTRRDILNEAEQEALSMSALWLA